MRISDGSSDVCSSDLVLRAQTHPLPSPPLEGEGARSRSFAGSGRYRPRRPAAGFSNHNTYGQAQSRASRQRVDRQAQSSFRSVSSTEYFQMTESFAELFEQSQTNLAKLKPGALVSGTVFDERTHLVVTNAGPKPQGIVPIEQFRNDEGEIDVAV